MTDGVQRAMTRQIRCAWEVYAVTERGMRAGEALRAFDNWMDSIAEPAQKELRDRELHHFETEKAISDALALDAAHADRNQMSDDVRTVLTAALIEGATPSAR